MSRLAVTVDGPKDAPVVVLLHAIATTGMMWSPQRLAWSHRFRLLCLDLPGHGNSPALPGAPGFCDVADAVARTVEEQGVARAAFVGLSFGAMVVQRLAAERPDLVATAVLANTVAFVPDSVRDAWRARIVDAQARGMAGQAEATLERWFTPSFLSRAPLTIAAMRAMVLGTPVAGYAAAAGAIAALDHRALLPRIACPTLVVTGEFDAAAPAAAGADIAAAVPRGRLLHLEAPHLSNVEQATAFNEGVGAFLAEALAA